MLVLSQKYVHNPWVSSFNHYTYTDDIANNCGKQLRFYMLMNLLTLIDMCQWWDSWTVNTDNQVMGYQHRYI